MAMAALQLRIGCLPVLLVVVLQLPPPTRLQRVAALGSGVAWRREQVQYPRQQVATVASYQPAGGSKE